MTPSTTASSPVLDGPCGGVQSKVHLDNYEGTHFVQVGSHIGDGKARRAAGRIAPV